jgi:hypothetical protein
MFEEFTQNSIYLIQQKKSLDIFISKFEEDWRDVGGEKQC